MGGQTLTRSYSYDKRAQSLNLYTCFAILDYEIQSEKKNGNEQQKSEMWEAPTVLSRRARRQASLWA